MLANNEDPDQTPCYAASDLGPALFANVPKNGSLGLYALIAGLQCPSYLQK